MIRALYTAATGMNAQDINVATISNNIANVNSTGYKKSRAEFQDLLYQNLRLVGTLSPNGNQIPTGSQLGLGVKLGSVAKIYTQGDMIRTQNQLDVAITGKGFFQIALPDGTIAYTRAGSFKKNNTGLLVTADGLPLEPAITIPQDDMQISIDQNGSVAVTQPGAVAPGWVTETLPFSSIEICRASAGIVIAGSSGNPSAVTTCPVLFILNDPARV